jgi:hypothetical protein
MTELIQILNDHPELFETALRLVVEQAQLLGLIPEENQKAG